MNANVDTQPVINHCKAFTYMCASFIKYVDEISEATKQVAKDACNLNKNNFEQMKSIARAYATKRECSVQEAVTKMLTRRFVRQSVIYRRIDIKCVLMKWKLMNCLKNTNIFKKNMIYRYIDRPNSQFSVGKYRYSCFYLFF